MKKISQWLHDLTCSQNIKGGGSLIIEGKATFNQDVEVRGWLHAPHVLTPCVGFFATAEELAHFAPRPRPGQWAMVGASIPAEIYRVANGAWTATGETYQPQVVRQVVTEGDPTLSGEVSTLNSRLSALTAEVSTVNTQLSQLGGVVTTLGEDVGALRDLLDEVEGVADSNREFLTSLAAQTGSLSETLASTGDSLRESINDLESEVAKLDTAQADLYADLTEALKRGVYDFVVFNGFHNDTTYWWDEVTAKVTEVKWHPELHRFVGAKLGGGWATAWKGSDLYQNVIIQDGGTREVVPHPFRFYYNLADNTLYRISNNTLVAV